MMDETPFTELEERLLTEVLAGERQAHEPEVQEACGRNPALRVAVEELTAAQRDLDRAGLRERELLAAAEAPDDPGMEALVARTVDRLAAEDGAKRARRGLPMLGWLAAAAAAALLLFWALGGGGEPPRSDDDQQLGDRRLVLEAPTENVDGGIELRWSCAAPVRSYSVTLYDPTDPAAGALSQSGLLNEARWTVERSALRTLPPGTRWRVAARLGRATISADRRLR